MGKRAILIASVGTSQVDALEKTTYRLLSEVKEKFSDIPCYVAFLSHGILNKMKEKNIDCCGICEALERMSADGIDEIVIQPTNLLSGQENSGLMEQIEPYRENFTKISVGKPLLFSKDDYIETLRVLYEAAELKGDEALVLIGHGSAHAAGNTYQNLEYTAYVQGYRNVFVATLEEKSQRMTLRKLGASGYKKVCMMPLLFVAGYHAAKDIMAEDGSWKTILENEGYEVRTNFQGIGELVGIREIFKKHLEDVFGMETT